MKYSTDGDLTLESLDGAESFTEWMFEQVRPELGGTILEIGSGRGTYSHKVLRDFPDNRIILSDIDGRYLEQLRSQFPAARIDVLCIDVENAADFARIAGPIDSAFALNVLEHTRDDRRSLRNVYDILRPGGRFVVIVPAHPILFGTIDRGVGHTRRYTKLQLMDALAGTAFRIKRVYYFNALSVPGWFVAGRILNMSSVSPAAMSVYARLVPLMRIVEKHVLRRRFGLSLVALLEK
jgi:SAM-dependent methyltransferase